MNLAWPLAVLRAELAHPHRPTFKPAPVNRCAALEGIPIQRAMITKFTSADPGLQGDAGPDQKPPRDRFFCPHHTAAGENVRAIVSEAIEVITAYEAEHRLRRRARKADDQRRFAASAEAVIADMAFAYLRGDERGSAISFSKKALGKRNGKRSRYQPWWMTENLPTVIRRMADTEYVRLEKGRRKKKGDHRGQRTLIWPGDRLIEWIDAHDISRDEIGWAETDETIILKSEKQNYWDEADRIEYEDTQVTHRFRAELADVNGWLANADLTLDPVIPVSRAYDLRDRRLCRHFSRGSFESGGRLFGGFWQNMTKQDRLAIRIGGEPVVTLDYRQMAPRLLYGISNAIPEADDMYAIQGIHLSYRDGTKTLFNAMLFTNEPLPKKPKGTKALLPNDDVQTLCSFIIRSHPDIAQHFFTEVGHRLQLIESEIMIKVLRELRRHNIVALPIHDAVVVAGSKAGQAKAVMQWAAKRVAGITIPVAEEEPTPHQLIATHAFHHDTP